MSGLSDWSIRVFMYQFDLFPSSFLHTCQQKKRRLEEEKKQVKDRQSEREGLRWETFFLLKNGGNPEGNEPINAGSCPLDFHRF